MRPFEYEQVLDPAAAVAAVAGRPGAAFLAGGTNLVDHLKLGVATPDVLVDVSRLPLDGRGGHRRRRAADRCRGPQQRPRGAPRRAPRLPRARAGAARRRVGPDPQRRDDRGNLLQRTRCVYFQDVTTPCNKREPGSRLPRARRASHRNHAILGASEHCVATHPSDLAVALAALDAVVVVLGPTASGGCRSTDLHRLPGDHPEPTPRWRTASSSPPWSSRPLPVARRSAYRKVRDRASYAFALVSVAAALDVEDGAVRDVRIALGGVAHKPWRATRAEEALRGGPATEEPSDAAAEAELARP